MKWREYSYVALAWLFLRNFLCLCSSAEVNGKTEIFTPISSEKLKSLGWKPRKLEETLTDSIEYYEKTGILQDAGGRPCVLPYLFHFLVEN